jgi:hypothetical protein
MTPTRPARKTPLLLALATVLCLSSFVCATTPVISAFAPRQALAAASDSDQEKIDAVFSDTSTHTGTLQYGDMTIDIPNTLVCSNLTAKVSESAGVTYEKVAATYNGGDYVLLTAFFGTNFVEDLYNSYGMERAEFYPQLIETIWEGFEDSVSSTFNLGSFQVVDGASVSRLTKNPNVYVGVYQSTSTGTLVTIGGAFDQYENFLFFEFIGSGSSNSDEVLGTILSITGAADPDSPISPRPSSSSNAIPTNEEDASASQASESSEQDRIDAVFTDTSDHKGTLGFGDMSITVPESATVESFNAGVDNNGVYVRTAYELKTGSLFLWFCDADATADVLESADDDPEVVIEAVALSLVRPVDEEAEITKYPEVLIENIYYGAIVGDLICAIYGGGYDGDGNGLFFTYVPFSGTSDEQSSEIASILYTFTGTVDPDEVSWPTGKGDSTASGGSSSSKSASSSSKSSSSSATTGEKNALARAQDYLAVMAFSRSGLIDQLEYEGYTATQAEYAVDHCGADWDEQAVLKAKEYLDVMSFSRSGLIDQLEYEGFSHSQASAAATKVGL